MSARAWQTRRTKQGLAVRCWPRIDKAMKRDKGKPLPRVYRGRAPGGTRITVTLSEPDPLDRYYEDEDVWDEED